MKQRQEYYCSICCAAMLAFAPLAASAQQTPQPVIQPKAAPGQKTVAPQKPVAPKSVAKRPRGPIEKLDCKTGTEDHHARIAVLAQGGDVQSLAYYSKWKPRTCSIHLQRGDAYSKWSDTGDATIVTTEFGDVLVQEKKAEYRFIFRDIDRMHYCGMMGKLNGSMTITRGPKRACTVEGLMERDEPEKESSTQAEAKPPTPEARLLLPEARPPSSEVPPPSEKK